MTILVISFQRGDWLRLLEEASNEENRPSHRQLDEEAALARACELELAVAG